MVCYKCSAVESTQEPARLLPTENIHHSTGVLKVPLQTSTGKGLFLPQRAHRCLENSHRPSSTRPRRGLWVWNGNGMIKPELSSSF